MDKRLVITEKPSVARDVARALGGFTDHEDWLESDRYVVTWAVGHLLELAEPEEYDKKWASWAMKNLPILPESFMIRPRKESNQKRYDSNVRRLDTIRKLGERPDVHGVINACDAGREGELIFRRIAEYCGLGDHPSWRLWLQSMTAASIRDAFLHLREAKELDGLGDAAFCRAVGDWLVGMNATRALTQRLRSGFDNQAWSVGRVQTPTLHLIVEREREILAHVPRPYWEIVATWSYGAQTWESRWFDPKGNVAVEDEDGDPDAKPSRLFDPARVARILAGVRGAGKGIAGEKRRRSKQNPPLLFDLTSLQREANRRFGFSARRTLDAAQRLYEGHKVLTYPRTDSRHLPADYGDNVRTSLTTLAGTPTYGALATTILGDGPKNLDKLLDDSKVSDHFAIVPTGTLPEGPLSNDDERVFDLVVRQFLAALMGPATWTQVERIVAIDLPAAGAAPAETARFRATGRTLEDPGYLLALGVPQAAALPPLVPGQDAPTGLGAALVDAAEEAKETKPPSRYNEAQLLRMMETAGERVAEEDLAEVMKGHGIGTPATRADIIERLLDTQYVRRIDGRLGATSKAMRMMDVLDRTAVGALASPRLTGDWEFALRQMESGKVSRGQMLERLRKFTNEVTENLRTFEHAALYANDATIAVCPNCGDQVHETTWNYKCRRNDRDNPACDFVVWKDRAGRYMDRATVQRLIADGKIGPVDGFVDRQGREIEARLTLARDPEKGGKWAVFVEYGAPHSSDGPVEVEEERGVLGPSPADPKDEIVETNLRYVARSILSGAARSGPVLPRRVCQREITPDEARGYFGADAKTDVLEGFVSKRGRPFTATLVRKDSGRHGFEFPEREGDARPRGKAGPGKGRGARGKGADEASTEAPTVAKGRGGGGKAAKSTAKAATAKGASGKAVSAKAAGGAAAAKGAGKSAKAASAAGGGEPAAPKGKGVAGVKGPKAKAKAEAAAKAKAAPKIVRRRVAGDED